MCTITGCVDGPVLGAEDLAHGVGVVGVRAEPVDRFRRKRDQLAGAQRFDSLLDLLLQYSSDSHGENDNKGADRPSGARRAEWRVH